MLANYFKLALRTFQKHKTSTGIHLLGLTLGVSGCLAIYLITGFELGYDTFHPDNERIYRVVGGMKFGPEREQNTVGFVPYALPKALRAEVSGLEQVAAFHNFESAVKIPGAGKPDKLFEHRNMEVDRAEIILVEPEYFSIFKYEWVAGEAKTALSAPFQVVLSEKKARKYFGDLPAVECIGKTVVYADSLQMTVSGVVRDWTQASDLAFTDFLSFSTLSNSFLKAHYNLNEWDDLWSASQAFVKLEETATLAQVEGQFPAFAKAHFTGNLKFQPALQPLSALHFDADYGDNYSRKAHLPTLYGLMGIAAFILLLAVINFVNLSTAQSFQRAKEVGIRKVMGSSRKSLVFQFLSETFLLTAVAGLLSLLVVPQTLLAFAAFVPEGVRLQYNAQVLTFLGLVAVGTALLAGLYPAFALSGFLPARTLKGPIVHKNRQQGALRKSLIVFQFAVSLVFILGTLLVNRQIAFMRHKDLGFQPEAVLTLTAPRGSENKLPVLYPKIQQLTGVQKAALQLFEPMGQNFGLDRVVFKGKTEQVFDAAYKMGDENFIPFYGMKLLAGRNLMKSEEAKEMVITANFVKALGFQTPEAAIGQSLYWRDKAYPIVGVVADFHQQSMHDKIPPTFITTTKNARNIAVKLSGQTPVDVEATIAQMASLWATVYPEHKMEYSFLEDTIARFYEKERKTARLVNFATFIAILISCLGLYGLSIFSTAQRTKEIGIRKVLGASVGSVVSLLSKDILSLVLLALVLASPVAWYFMQRWLADFAYRIDIQWWMFAAAGLAAVLIAFLTVGFQSARAALTNPVQSLRSE